MMSKKSKDKLLTTYLNTPPDEFIGLLVHDVRGPLSGIISAAKLMDVLLTEDSDLNHEQMEEIVKIIQKAASNMRVVLDTAIEYDRLQPRVPLEKTSD